MTIGSNNVGDVSQTTTQTTTNVDNTPATVSNNATNNRQVTDVTNQSESQAQQATSNDNRNAFQKMVDGFCEKFGEFWSKVEKHVENSRLFHGLQGVREAAVTTKEMTQEATANALGHDEQAIQVRVDRDMRLNRPADKLSAETSYTILNAYPGTSHHLNESFLLKELDNKTPLAKVLTKQIDKEFATENLEFLKSIQENFLIDADAPLSRQSQNLDFTLGDTLEVHSKFVRTNSDLQINIAGVARNVFSQDIQNYLEALKDLELATRAQTEDNPARIETAQIPAGQLNKMTPVVQPEQLAQLEAVDVKRSETLEQSDPLFAQKQAVLDCKENLDISFRAAAKEATYLLNAANTSMVIQLQKNIEGTRFDPQANAAPAPTIAPTVAPTLAPAGAPTAANDQITHSSTFSHSHMTLAHISKAADVIEPTNSLSVDDLSVPQNDDQLAISDETNGNVSNNPIGRTHTYGNTLTVPGMGEN